MPDQLGNLSQMKRDAHPSTGELHRADKGTAPVPKPDDWIVWPGASRFRATDITSRWRPRPARRWSRRPSKAAW